MVVSVSGKLYDHQLKEAHMLATSLLHFTQAFHEYTSHSNRWHDIAPD